MTDQPGWNELLDLVARLDDGGFDNVSVQLGDLSVRMSRHSSLIDDAPAHARAPAPEVPRAPAPPATEPAAASELPAATPSPAVAAKPVGASITSPMIGVFYRQASPGTPPFVEPGQAVEADTTIGIIEIMKLMNPVKAGIAGVIHEFFVKDGEAVEFGQALAVLDAGVM